MENIHVDAIFAVMNRLSLGGMDQAIDISNPMRIVGTGAKETLNVAGDASIMFTAGDGDRVNLPHNLSDYTITASGVQLYLVDGGGNRITLSVNGTSTVGFADGAAELKMVFAPGQMPYILLGGAVVGNESLDPGDVGLDADPASHAM